MSKLGLGLGLAGVAAAAIWAVRAPSEGAAAEGPRWKTAPVVEAPIEVTVAATGTVQPAFQVEVKSKASGEVVDFPLGPGDPVAAGALLVQLDPRDEARNVRLAEADVASNRAAVAAAEADLGLAESRLVRDEDLAKKSLVSPEELDGARFGRARAAASVDLAKATLVRSEVALDVARQRLADCRIVAPIAGIVLTKAVDRGHIISSGITSISGGTTLATIADMSRVFVLADVDEADVGKVKPGAAARVTVDAFRDVAFDGRVDRLMPLGVEDQNVTVFRANIEVTSPNKSLLLPNMTTNVRIHVASRERALVVPNAALKQRDGKVGVEVLAAAGGAPQWREVARGLTDGTVTEVEGGAVKAGELVVTGEEKVEEPKRGFFSFGGGPKKTGASTSTSTGASTGAGASSGTSTSSGTGTGTGTNTGAGTSTGTGAATTPTARPK
ncbi:MAG TPA: efflux RND transporter periplasmic adaptor subunit [Planctomycetota bacterium]|nr:efflux RND transporter periplasmic adaptor subunit [Planctomycetota bacterium]